jgi:hypothetical protein
LRSDDANNVFAVFNNGPQNELMGYNLELASADNPGNYAQVHGIDGHGDFPATLQLGRYRAAVNLQDSVNVYSKAAMTPDDTDNPNECGVNGDFSASVGTGLISQVAVSRSSNGRDDDIYAIYCSSLRKPDEGVESFGYLMKVFPTDDSELDGDIRPLMARSPDGNTGYMKIPNPYPQVLFVKSGKVFVGQQKTKDLLEIDLATGRTTHTYPNALPDPLTSPSYFNDHSAFHAAIAYFGTRGGIYRIEL